MQYELKKPFEVMNKQAGAYVKESTVEVNFLGRKGLQSIKHLQDVIFGTFSAQSGKAREQTAEEIEKQRDKVVTVDEILDMLEVTGGSAKLFDEVMNTLKEFGTIGDSKLTDSIMDEMDFEDLDGLYNEVLKTFLLQKITQRLNSMSK